MLARAPDRRRLVEVDARGQLVVGRHVGLGRAVEVEVARVRQPAAQRSQGGRGEDLARERHQPQGSAGRAARGRRASAISERMPGPENQMLTRSRLIRSTIRSANWRTASGTSTSGTPAPRLVKTSKSDMPKLNCAWLAKTSPGAGAISSAAPACVRRDRRAAHHPALVAAGGARRVEHAGELGFARGRGLAGRRRPALRCAWPSPTGPIGSKSPPRPSRRAGVAVALDEALLDQRRADAAVRQDLGVALRGRARVDGHVGAARAQHAQHRRDGVARAVQVEADPRVALDAERDAGARPRGSRDRRAVA